MHTTLRILFAIWAVAFPVISCGPVVLGLREGVGGTLVGVFTALVLSSALFVPWIFGLVVLGIGVYLTRPAASWRGDTEGRVIGEPRGSDGPRQLTAGRRASPSTATTDVPPGRFLDARLIAGLVLLIGGLLALVLVATR